MSTQDNTSSREQAKTYQEFIDWAAHRSCSRYDNDLCAGGTNEYVLCEVAHAIYNKTIFGISNDIKRRIEELYGNPLKGTRKWVQQ